MSFCGESVHLGERAPKSGGLCRRFVLPAWNFEQEPVLDSHILPFPPLCLMTVPVQAKTSWTRPAWSLTGVETSFLRCQINLF